MLRWDIKGFVYCRVVCKVYFTNTLLYTYIIQHPFKKYSVKLFFAIDEVTAEREAHGNRGWISLWKSYSPLIFQQKVIFWCFWQWVKSCSAQQNAALQYLVDLNEQTLCQFPNGQAPGAWQGAWFLQRCIFCTCSTMDFQRSLACAVFWLCVWLGGLPRISVHALVWIRAHCITSVSFCTAFPPALFLYFSFLICHASR